VEPQQQTFRDKHNFMGGTIAMGFKYNYSILKTCKSWK